jgi:hypothetical protein
MFVRSGTMRIFTIFLDLVIDSFRVEAKTGHAPPELLRGASMAKNVSDGTRRVLDNPVTRYRIVDAWVLLQRKEELEAKKATRDAAAKKVTGKKK